MTMTETAPAPAAPGRKAQIRDAVALIGRLLADRGQFSGGAAAADALGRATAANRPGSDHGQLLARTVRALRASPSGLPGAADERAVWHLACRGQTPSPAAVADRVRAQESARARGIAAASRGPVTEEEGRKAAAFVADVIARTGSGPTWRELADGLGWQSLTYATRGPAVHRLTQAGWLETGEAERSLRPGRKAQPGGTQ